jgi:hypothetical protein
MASFEEESENPHWAKEYANLQWGFFSDEEQRDRAEDAARKLAKIARILEQNEEAFCREMAKELDPSGLDLPDGVELADFIEPQNKLLAARDALARLPKAHRMILEIKLELHVDNDDDAGAPGDRLLGHLEGLLYCLNELTDLWPELIAPGVRSGKRGRPKGSVRDHRLNKLVAGLFTLTRHYNGRLPFDKKKKDGGPRFQQAWAALVECLPSLPRVPPLTTIDNIRRGLPQ